MSLKHDYLLVILRAERRVFVTLRIHFQACQFLLTFMLTIGQLRHCVSLNMLAGFLCIAANANLV